jgi:uncharacterized protein YuzE
MMLKQTKGFILTFTVNSHLCFDKIMKVSYDDEIDIAYIQFSSKKPDGGVELAEGVILHTTANDEVVGLEIIKVSKKMPLKNSVQL